MAVELYDTLTRTKKPLETREPGKLRMYVCGPTTYDYAHIGHARCYVVYDILARHLKTQGTEVTYVRNITDVDDKIVKRAQERGEDPLALAERFRLAYAEDMARLKNLCPDVEPKVTDHIQEIIALIQTLIEQDHAYVSGGDVYFAVDSFADYGKLSHRKPEDIRSGASERVDAEESARKRQPSDFALWKGCSENTLHWSSPWGPGRPGWHIECSAMSQKYLGNSFDLHGGGLDLIFPHHENELAQSEAATGECFVGHWMHNGFVQVNKEKMSKSLGNFFGLRQAFELHEPEAVRLALLTMHYRGPLNLDWELDEAGELKSFPPFRDAELRLEKLYQAKLRFSEIGKKRFDANQRDLSPEISELGARIAAALDDDLNTPVALAHLSAFQRQVNELIDRAQKEKIPAPAKDAVAAAFQALEDRLGLGSEAPLDFLRRVRDRRAAKLGIDAPYVAQRLQDRSAARKAKDFAQADAIRDELSALGVELLDRPDGTDWTLSRSER